MSAVVGAAPLRRLVSSPVRRASVNSLLGAVVTQAMLVISGSLSARILGPSDRGHYALLILIPSVLCIAGSLGLSTSLSYHIARAPRQTTALAARIRRDVLSQVAVVTLVHVAVTTIWLIPSLPAGDRAAGLVTLAAVPVSFVNEYSLAVLQGHQAFTRFTFAFVLPPILTAAGVACLFVLGGAGLTTVVSVSVGASAISGAVALSYAFRLGRAAADDREAESLSAIRRFARRSYFGGVAPIESFRLDQLAVGIACSPAVLGFYSVATAFSNLARFLGTSMGNVLAPYIAALPPDRQARSLARGLLATLAVCGVVTALLVPAVHLLVPLLFGSPFAPAVPVAQVLLVSGFLLGVRRAALPGLQGMGWPEIGSYSEAVALAVFVVLLPLALGGTSGLGVALVFLVSAAAAILAIAVMFRRRVRRTDA